MKTALVYIFGTALFCQALFVAGIATPRIAVDWTPQRSTAEVVKLASLPSAATVFAGE